MRLLAPLAPTLEKLYLGNNKLGGTITDDIAAFTELTELWLMDMGLGGVVSQLYRAANRDGTQFLRIRVSEIDDYLALSHRRPAA